MNCEQSIFRILVWTGADLRSMQSVRLGQGDDDAEPVSDITDICRAATPEAHEKYRLYQDNLVLFPIGMEEESRPRVEDALGLGSILEPHGHDGVVVAVRGADKQHGLE